MNNEPKVKYSDKYWLYSGMIWGVSPRNREVYDKLLSLEAKIELLTLFVKHYDDGERFLGFLEDHQSELAELIKEHNLI